MKRTRVCRDYAPWPLMSEYRRRLVLKYATGEQSAKDCRTKFWFVLFDLRRGFNLRSGISKHLAIPNMGVAQHFERYLASKLEAST